MKEYYYCDNVNCIMEDVVVRGFGRYHSRFGEVKKCKSCGFKLFFEE